MPLCRGTRFSVVVGNGGQPTAPPAEPPEEMVGGEQGADLVPTLSPETQETKEPADGPGAPAR